MTHVSTAEFTIADLNDGLNAYLTQTSCLIVTNADGSGGNYAIANTTMVIRQGTADVSTEWTVTATPSAGVTGSLSTRTYSVSAMAVDNGYVDLTATRPGETAVTLRFTIAKAKQGVTGERGTIVTARDISPASTWSDVQAAMAIADAGGVSPQRGDVVTLYNSAASWTQTRVRTTGGTWALLAAFFGGDVLVDGTVVANKLAVNSVTANAIAAGAVGAVHMQSGSILTSKLTVTDFSNVIPDPDFAETGTTWTNPAGTVDVVVAGSPEWSRPFLLRIIEAGSVARASVGQPIPVLQGETFWFQYQTRVVLGSGVVRAEVQFSATADFATILSTVTGSGTTSTSVTTESFMVPVPASARFARLRFFTAAGVTQALFGAPILRRAASGELIVDGSVITTKLAAGAVSADKLQAGSVLASKLAISDMSNLIPDGEMADAAAWGLPEGWSLISNAAGSGYDSPGSLFYAHSGGTGYSAPATSGRFPVEAGKPYYFRYQTSGLAAYQIWGRVHWFDAAQAELAIATIHAVAATGLQDRSAALMPPALAKYAEVRFYVQRDTTTNHCGVAGLSCRRMASGELIVDGSIQAVHVGTNEIVANTANIKDGIITNAKIVELSAAKLIAGTALASTITVNGTTLDLVEGRAADPAARINIANTKIDPGKITITGATTLADWRKGGDETKIDGGAISANTIATNKLTVGNRGFTVTAVTFDYNATTNTVSWSGGFVRWVNDAGVTTNTSIAAGSAVWSSGVLYICFDKTGVLKALNIAAAFADNAAILATYQGGKNLIVDYGKTIIDGGMVKTGTLKADSVDTSSFSTAGMAVFGGDLKSSDFSAGVSGWRIQNNGDAEFGTLALREGAVSAVYGAEQGAEINTQATWLTICSLTFTPSTNRQLLVMYSALLRCIPSFAGGDDIQTVFDAVNYRIVWRGSAARSRTLALIRTNAFAQRGQHINDIMLVSPGGLTSGTLEFQFQRGSADASRAYASQATLVAQELKR